MNAQVQQLTEQIHRLELEMFAYNGVKENVSETFEEWSEKAQEHELKPLYDSKNVLMAVFIIKDNEVHVVSHPNYSGKWWRKNECNKIFQDIINEYGSVITAVSANNLKELTYARRVGFEPKLVTFEMTKIGYK